MPSSETSSVSGATGFSGAGHTKPMLKEAVDAVLNSFAKHTKGYGRGNQLNSLLIF